MSDKLKIVFMGTPEFAVASLDALIQNNCNIVGVITVPDKPAGRGQKIQISAVKEFALKHDLKILQPTNLKDENFIKELRSLKADLQIVVAFRMLPEIVWNMPPLGTFNLHGSLLPKYRGAAPINWAVMNGDAESGVTTFKLSHEIDTGNILFREKVKLDDTTTAGELHDELMVIGAKLIVKSVKAIDDSRSGIPLNFIKQDDTLATHAPKLYKDTCKINWTWPLKKIYDHVRGLSPYPTAFTEFVDSNGQTQILKIYKAVMIANSSNTPKGLIDTDNKTFIHINCADGILQLIEVQLQGKKRMAVKEFLNGYKFSEGTLLK
ncbi:MAG: methionyl-tRNA formyltransferase [Sphingobacteriaceae bacterium]|nr:methionyl-tRNA formyltransferase [Sphingobacteriaceae bacterium]